MLASEQHIERFRSVAGRRGWGHALRRSSGLLGVVEQDAADHVLLTGCEIDLRGSQLSVSQYQLDIGQRQHRILGHPVGRRVT